MTAAEFQTAACALIGTTLGWQTKIAARLGINRRTVLRWLADDEVPPWAEERMAELMGMQALAPWPRDEWIIGDGVGEDGRTREYIVHAAPPRFVARIVACDVNSEAPEDSELPADVVTGAVYRIDPGTVLCEVAWIDEPRPGEVVQLLEAAADAVERQTERDAESL